jgi:hypothetical protein
MKFIDRIIVKLNNLYQKVANNRTTDKIRKKMVNNIEI